MIFCGSAYAWDALGDRFGLENLHWFGYNAVGLLAFPAHVVMVSLRSAWILAISSGLVVLFVALFGSLQQTVLASLFPPHMRNFGAGFAFAMALAIAGGTTEVIALSFKAAGRESWHFWLIGLLAIAAAGVALVVRSRLPRNAREAQHSVDDIARA